jgi:hypothetical protein
MTRQQLNMLSHALNTYQLLADQHFQQKPFPRAQSVFAVFLVYFETFRGQELNPIQPKHSAHSVWNTFFKQTIYFSHTKRSKLPNCLQTHTQVIPRERREQ